MDKKKPWECADMDQVRSEIDRIDGDLVELISERFGYVDRAWQLKENPADATVPWRIEQVIKRVREHAEKRQVPPQLAEALWRQMIGWFVQYEEEKLRKSQANDSNQGT